MAAHVVVKLWRTLALAILAALLGVYIYLVEQPRVAEEAAGDSLVKLTPKDVTAVSLRYPGSQPIRLERDGDAWRLREPVDFPADGAVVDRLLEQIAETKVERRIKLGEAQPLAVYGLEGDGEQARISLTTSGDAEIPDIVVGRTTPVGYSAFARVDGVDAIAVTPLLFHTGIKKSVLELRKKRLFEVDAQQVIAMRISDSGRAVELERRGDDWAIKSPIDARADSEQVRGLIAALNEIEAVDFLDTPPGDAGVSVAGLQFHATLAEGGEIGFRLKPLDATPPATYALERIEDGLRAKVEESVKVRFTKDVGALRDKRLFLCGADDATEIRFDRADGGGFSLVRDGDEWTLRPPVTDGTLREPVVRRTVGGIVALAGKDVAMESASATDLPGFGLDTPVVEVEVLKADGSSCGRALTGVKGAGSETPAYYVKRNDSGLVTTLPSYLYSRIDVRRDDLVEKKAPVAPAPPNAGATAPE